jgi:hypothetical protein
MPNAVNINPNEQEMICSGGTSGSTDKRKLNARKPKAAGNCSFKKDNGVNGFMKDFLDCHKILGILLA